MAIVRADHQVIVADEFGQIRNILVGFTGDVDPIITEKIFGWPGLGLLLVEDGIGKRDYRVVQGCVLVISLTYIVANSLTDMIYRWLDPRIRVS